LSQDNGSKILNIPSFTSKYQSTISQFYSVLYNSSILTALLHTTTNDQMFIYNKIGPMSSTIITTNISNYSLPFVANCRCSISPNNKYMAFWD